MAAVIGDYVADHSRFHNMIASPGLQHEHSHSRDSQYRSEYNSRPRETPQISRTPPSPVHYRGPAANTTPSKRSWDSADSDTKHKQTSNGGASRLPSPPDSSASNPASARVRAQNAESPTANPMSTQTQTQTAALATTTAAPTPAKQQPSPESNASKSSLLRSPAYNVSAPQEGRTIVVRDLAHIQSLARADLMNGGNGTGILNDPPFQETSYEISGMPIGDIIEMVAALLTKMTTTNDLKHDALHRNAAHQQTAANHNNDGSSMSPLSSSVLAFHGKNVPAITILSYLSRIHKYCPTTYEVFLSLVVYFDSMHERVNSLLTQAEETRRQTLSQTSFTSTGTRADDSEGQYHTENEADDGDPGLIDDDGQVGQETSGKEERPANADSPSLSPATRFVVDSFNIHRLIIAGVTCASKFFSDVFYTNSRYAKVGGLPLAELNHLELQFLLLNDFRLSIPVENLQHYATMLVEFYAREVVAQRFQPTAGAE
ncbi:cyclin-domain-containing protein [Xylariaceae sp. FL0016]|nr:cyclin-domain-containing protein [Xylariaceae sp. FL0016]